MHKPEWLACYNWQWAEEGDLSKLLNTPFGLNLNTPDIDQFFYAKIAKKLDYWNTMNSHWPREWSFVTRYCYPPYGSLLRYGEASTRFLERLGMLSATTYGLEMSNLPALNLPGKSVA